MATPIFDKFYGDCPDCPREHVCQIWSPYQIFDDTTLIWCLIYAANPYEYLRNPYKNYPHKLECLRYISPAVSMGISSFKF